MKRGLKLNLIKNMGKNVCKCVCVWGGGGGGNPTTLTVSSLVSELFDKEAKSDEKIVGERGEGGTETKTVCYTVSNEVNTKVQLSTQCRACGTINISKYINNFLSTNPTTFYIELTSK